MQNGLEILNNLTEEQRAEFEKDIQELYEFCTKQPGFPTGSRNEVSVNMNLSNQIFLKVTFDFVEANSDKVKGRILQVHRYENEEEYRKAVAGEVIS